MRALSRNTRRVTALTLAAALVIAVYLNWQYARADITPQTEDDTLMVSAEPVEAEAETAITDALPTEAEAASGASKNYGEAQLVSVANDSGNMHLSAVLGGKGVAPFGPTDPAATSPVSAKWSILFNKQEFLYGIKTVRGLCGRC